MRKLLLLVLVVAVIGAGSASLAFGRLLAAAIETAGTAALGVKVEVGMVTVAPWSGKGRVRGLVVGNPEGYSGPYAFKADLIEVALKPASLLGDSLVVESVVVRGPSVRLETGPGGTNLSRLRGKASSGSSGGGRSVRIKRLDITGAQMSLPGGITSPLPDVHLKDLGGRSALDQVLGVFSKGVGSSVLDGVGGLLRRLR